MMTEDQKEAEPIKKCPTKLLDDLPSDKDAFGGHERIAKAIAELVRTQKGGKAIALIGTWGSGKSTVIEILEKELELDNDSVDEFLLIKFDAWAHSGNTLRRAFLSEFASKVDKWDEEKAVHDLVCEFLHPNTTSIQHIPFYAKVFAILIAFCIPIGSSLMRYYGQPNLYNDWFYVGLGVISLPFFIAFIFYQVAKYHDHMKDSLSFQVEHINVTDILPEQDSYEFQSTFHKVLKLLLENNTNNLKHRKIIIVVDNLDRLKTCDAIDFWATLQTFFEFNNPNSQLWNTKFWIIVPFAQSAAEKIWSVNGLEDESDTIIAREFIEKTFQIRYYVPQPILPDWKSYLREALRAAFYQDNIDSTNLAEQIEEVIDVFYKCGHKATDTLNLFDETRDRKIPSPREIKLFVNQLVTSYNLWPLIPLKTHAFYILIRNLDNSSVLSIVSGSSDVKECYKLLGRDYINHLPVLHFNLEEKKAVHVIAWMKIKAGLEQGEYYLFNNLIDDLEFYTECRRVIIKNERDWRGSGHGYFALAAYALNQCYKTQEKKWSEIWDILKEGGSETRIDLTLDFKIAEGLYILYQRHLNEQRKALFVTDIFRNITKWHMTEDRSNSTVRLEWIKGAQYLILKFRDQYPDIIKNSIQISDQENYYEDFKRKLQSFDYNFYVFSIFIRDMEILSKFLDESIDKIGKGLYTNQDFEHLDVLLSTYHKIPTSISKDDTKKPAIKPDKFFTLRKELEGRLKLDIDENEVLVCLKSLVNLRYKYNLHDTKLAFRKLVVDSGALYADMYKSHENPYVVGMCVLIALEFYPKTTNPSNTQDKHLGQLIKDGVDLYKRILGAPQNHNEIVSWFAKLVIQYDKIVVDIVELLLSNLKKNRPADMPDLFKFAQATLKEIKKSPSWNKYINDDIILKNRDILIELLGVDFPNEFRT